MILNSVRLARSIALAGLFLTLAAPAEAKKIKIKHGTLAPEGSPWHKGLVRMGDRWKKASDGKVRLKIYAGGVVGDEDDMLRKIRIGQLHSATITGIGLGRITRSTVGLQIPMMFGSYEELDYVRERITPKLEKELSDAGFVVLNWGDAGWVHFFSKRKGKVPEDFRKWKMFLWSGDPDSEKAWKDAGFQPVPMSSTDVVSSLQAGLIEWFGTPPIYALTNQWFALAKYMLAINWTPLNGATIISKKRWDKIPEDLRAELLTISKEEGLNVLGDIRSLGAKSIKAMKDRGLTIVEPNETILAEWKKAAEKGYPAIRNQVVGPEIFDEIKRLSEEYRASVKK